jgi:hypothetical protein
LGLDPDSKVQEADQSIFDLTSPIFSDPFRVAQGQPVELVMINQIEQENLLLDLALVANDASQALAKLPSIGTGMGNDLAMELIRLKRALNDREIDQLLGQAAKNLAGRYSRYSGTSPSGVSPLSDQSTGRRKN